MNNEEYDPEDLEPEISKSQRKRDADEIRDFAARLVQEKKQTLNRLPLSDEIRDAIAKCPAQSTRGAYKRHIQYISKLIRKTGDFETLTDLLDNPQVPDANPHEKMCLQLIDSFTSHADALREAYPAVSLQQARQLARAAQPVPRNPDEAPDEAQKAAEKKAAKAKSALLKLLSENA
jgi:ribosome-associated protein